MGSDKEMGISVNYEDFNNCDAIIRALAVDFRKEALHKFEKTVTLSDILYGPQWWLLTERHRR